MQRLTRAGCLIGFGMALWPLPAQAATMRLSPIVRIAPDETVADDMYVAGAQVEVDGHIQGDLIVAGGMVTVRGQIDGDLVAVGGAVTVLGPTGHAARIGASQVRLDAPVGGDFMAVAGEVTTLGATRVGGETWLRASDMSLGGDLGRKLAARGESLTLSGVVHGPARLIAPRLHLDPTVLIEGPLAIETLTPNPVSPGAQIRGGMQSNQLDRQSAWSAFWPWLLRWVSALISGLTLLWLCPHAMAHAADTAGRRPWRSMLVGLGMLFAAPMLAIMAMLSVLALPLGLMALGLYTAGIYLAQLVVAWGAARWWLRRQGDLKTHWKQAAALAIGLVLVFVLKSLMVVGPYMNFAIVLWGLGALAVTTYRWGKAQWTRWPQKSRAPMQHQGAAGDS